jgi:hypothetical protein
MRSSEASAITRTSTSPNEARNVEICLCLTADWSDEWIRSASKTPVTGLADSSTNGEARKGTRAVPSRRARSSQGREPVPKEDDMKYLLQIYPDGAREALERLPEDEQEAIREEYLALGQSPQVIGGDRLQPAETATTVRVQDGETLLTDGPFVDAKEHLGGYVLVEADDLDAALEIAARIPAARMGGAIEVRPLAER